MRTYVGSKMSEAGLALVKRYRAEGTSLDEKRNMFRDVLVLMKKYQLKYSSQDFGYAEGMYNVIMATPPEILSFNPSGATEPFYLIESFRKYVNLSLKEIRFGVNFNWPDLKEKKRKNFCSSMYTAFEAVGEVLIFRQKIFNSQLTPDDALSNYQEEGRDLYEEFKRKIDYSQELIENELDKLLDPVNLRRHVREMVNFSEETLKRIMQETQAFKTFIESVTFKQDATRFKTAADNHRKRARRSIGMALLLGVIGVIWGIFLSDQNLQTSCVGHWFCIPFNVGVRGFLLAASILVIGIYASVRSYFAHSQSEANNQQRFNALGSYENIIKLASNFSISKEAERLIMQKAVECIYSHQPTGFVKEQKDNDAKTTLVLPQILTPSTSDPRGG